MAVAWARDPDEVAGEAAAAHRDDPAWLDAFAEALDRQRARADLARIAAVWGMSRAEIGRLFGVSRQAIAKWIDHGVPDERAAAVADLAAATDLLVRYLRRDRIPGVVRRPADALGGRSLIELAAGDPAGVRRACQAMFDFAQVQE